MLQFQMGHSKHDVNRDTQNPAIQHNYESCVVAAQIRKAAATCQIDLTPEEQERLVESWTILQQQCSQLSLYTNQRNTRCNSMDTFTSGLLNQKLRPDVAIKPPYLNIGPRNERGEIVIKNVAIYEEMI